MTCPPRYTGRKLEATLRGALRKSREGKFCMKQDFVSHKSIARYIWSSPQAGQRLRWLGEGLHSFHGGYDVGQTNTEFFIHDHDFTPGHQFLIDQYFEGFAHHFGQFDHRPLP